MNTKENECILYNIQDIYTSKYNYNWAIDADYIDIFIDDNNKLYNKANIMRAFFFFINNILKNNKFLILQKIPFVVKSIISLYTRYTSFLQFDDTFLDPNHTNLFKAKWRKFNDIIIKSNIDIKCFHIGMSGVVIKNVSNKIFRIFEDEFKYIHLQELQIKKNNSDHVIISEGLFADHNIIICREANVNYSDRNILKKLRFKKHQYFYTYGNNESNQLGVGSFGKSPNNNISTVYECYHLSKYFKWIDIKQISCGLLHSLFLSTFGCVYGLGGNTQYQAGFHFQSRCIVSSLRNNNYQSPHSTIIPIRIRCQQIKYICSGAYHNLMINKENRLLVFGGNASGQCGLNFISFTHIQVPTFVDFFNRNVHAIATGWDFSIVTNSLQHCYTFGSNNECQLGSESCGLSTHIPFCIQSIYYMRNVYIKKISAGFNHSLIMSGFINDNKIYSFGSNCHNQCSINIGMHRIAIPTEITKYEIGLHSKDTCIKIIAGFWNTIIIYTASK